MDASRHLSVFNPDLWGDKRVDVIGCGATGSRVAVELTRMGVQNIHLWDFDDVEEPNIANQMWELSDIGANKAAALANRCELINGITPVVHGRATGSDEYGNIVFLLTDTISSRKEIFIEGLRFNNAVSRVIETRMGSIDGRIYSFNPNDLVQSSKWWTSLPDEDAPTEASLCGTSISIGPTAAAIIGYAVWSFIQFARDETFPNELIIGMNVPSFVSIEWPLFS